MQMYGAREPSISACSRALRREHAVDDGRDQIRRALFGEVDLIVHGNIPAASPMRVRQPWELHMASDER